MCRTLLRTFYDIVAAFALFYAIIFLGSGLTTRDRNGLEKLVRRTSSVVNCPLKTLEVGEREEDLSRAALSSSRLRQL